MFTLGRLLMVMLILHKGLFRGYIVCNVFWVFSVFSLV